MVNKHVLKVTISLVVISIAAAMFLIACGEKPASTLPPATTVPSKLDSAALSAKGEELFQQTAGGVGCKSCHGTNAKGASLGPNILGKTTDDIRRALSGEVMRFIHLTDEEVEAVATYLKSLQK